METQRQLSPEIKSEIELKIQQDNAFFEELKRGELGEYQNIEGINQYLATLFNSLLAQELYAF